MITFIIDLSGDYFFSYLFSRLVCKKSENSWKCPIFKLLVFKPQNIQFTIIQDKEKQQIITFEKLEP